MKWIWITCKNDVRNARDDMAANMSSSSEEQENAADEELPVQGPPENRRGRRSRKRPIAEVIRENQLLYNKFLKKKKSQAVAGAWKRLFRFRF